MKFLTHRRYQLRGSVMNLVLVSISLALAFNTAERVRLASLSSQDIAKW